MKEWNLAIHKILWFGESLLYHLLLKNHLVCPFTHQFFIASLLCVWRCESQEVSFVQSSGWRVPSRPPRTRAHVLGLVPRYSSYPLPRSRDGWKAKKDSLRDPRRASQISRPGQTPRGMDGLHRRCSHCLGMGWLTCCCRGPWRWMAAGRCFLSGCFPSPDSCCLCLAVCCPEQI